MKKKIIILTLLFMVFLLGGVFFFKDNIKITGNVVMTDEEFLNKSVGVDYHAIGSDWGADAFLVRYHNPAVREVVLSQLADMKSHGVEIISTRIWMIRNDEELGYLTNQYHHHFPLTEQELINLNQYAFDVANQNLTLTLTLLGLWCADFSKGTPTGLIGHETCLNSATDYILRFKSAVNGILNAVKDVRRADGKRLVDIFYFNGEARIEGWIPEENARWYYKYSGLWSWFYNTVNQTGIIPSMYFQAIPGAVHPVDTTIPYSDPLYNHATMESVAGSLKFLKNNNLPIPARIDFDFYVKDNLDGSYTPHLTIKKILDDFDAVIPLILGKPSVDYFIAETTHRKDTWRRYLNQKAWKENLYLRNNFKGVNFWTTPNASGNYHAYWPMDLDFLTNLGNTGLVSFNVINCQDYSAEPCTVNVSVNYIDAPSEFFILSVINPSNSEELFITCKSTSFTSVLSWFQRDINYTFILSTMNSLDTTSTCSMGSSLLSNPNRLILDVFTIARPVANCTSFTYSPWTTCNSSSLQSRTITSLNPSGCNGGTSENLVQQCSPPCLLSNWQSADSICLSSNTLTRTWTKIGNCNQTIGVSKPNSETISCTYVPNVVICTNFTYSNWSECLPNGIQNRILISKEPENCVANSELVRTCNYSFNLTSVNGSLNVTENPTGSSGGSEEQIEDFSNESSEFSENGSETNWESSENYIKPSLWKKFFCRIRFLFNKEKYSECLNHL